MVLEEPCAPPTDCDDNGQDDVDEIAAHPSLDFNADGILDVCQQGQLISDAVPGNRDPMVLHDPTPNPFNPSTVTAFDLDRERTADLSIYDVSGRLVRRLVRAEVGLPGRNEFVWDGRGGNGSLVASGVYFAGLVSGDEARTTRMVLLK